MPLKRLNAFALGNDDRNALVVNLLADDAGYLRHILGQGNHHMQMLALYAKTETDALVGILPVDDETCLAASKILKERCNCKYVVLKMGDKGSYIYGEGIAQMVPTFKVDAVDPTAAGDCFTGVLVMRYAETGDIVEAARYASAAAAISVQSLGAQPSLPMKDAIDAFYAERA